MLPWELFTLIRDTKHEDFVTVGDDVQFLIVIDEDEKVIRLLFEESKGKRDWQNNLKFPTKLYKKQETCLCVARGWGGAWKSCNDLVMNALIAHITKKQLLKQEYKVEISGWSYGGAIALLAAEDLHYRTGIKPDVITFGAPKVLFGKKTKEYLQNCVNEVHQYAHINDCVALLPPFPCYCNLHTEEDTIGWGNRQLSKLINPWQYHTCYGDSLQYFK